MNVYSTHNDVTASCFEKEAGAVKTGGGGLLSRLGIAKSALQGSAQPQQKIEKRKRIKNPYSSAGTNMRPLIIALVVSIRNHRDGRVATFRPIPQSVSGVGVRFSIGDKIRNLGVKSFCLTRSERKFFIYHCGAVIIFLSLFSRNWDSELSSETLWRSCGVGLGAGSAG
jgi:hypothetical protein